ncbi:uncharacterized protein CC84DRAFT_1235242 [Paraphaeosphaeria sporulosa]|uniref:Uncharacterized protein n=1 Tax=Paraphaeosphaeria sporulosa TaxID=1460663 RepID=A0A177CRT5_9PLEO|nr:uncharacterized protein CC84DRAFT_1235242 [Paraphaeosphaeria sporulosa]OAG09600.1 hypothetical protein CC84DRAFT_1235242 [Paraphaeosphaeria sporulosa]
MKTFTAPVAGQASLVEDTQQGHTTPHVAMDQTPDVPSPALFFKWGGEFPGGRVRPEQEQKKVDGELTEALPTAASPTAASSLSPANAASKKRGRGHEDAGEGEESTERVRLNIAAPNPDHDNVSTLAFVLGETTMQQAHIFQEPQRPNFTDEEAEPEDNTCLSFEAFTIRPQFEY